ncbi:MAG: hypothetical protein ABI340_10455 [Nitrososphaera sp.]
MKISHVKRRALSTVVTTAMMLTAVAVIGTGVVLWSNSNLRTFENNLAISASNNTNKINEVPLIEDVQLDPHGGAKDRVNVTVSNVGNVGFRVTTITISDSGQTKVNTVASGNIPIHSSQTFSYSYNWQSNLITTIQVRTARGTVISTQAVHP